uniref:Uncharacterized protein n=1 Tax=Quercus lobata TaxID=97700 RepID=A0A7N2N8D9_QUELO
MAAAPITNLRLVIYVVIGYSLSRPVITLLDKWFPGRRDTASEYVLATFEPSSNLSTDGPFCIIFCINLASWAAVRRVYHMKGEAVKSMTLGELAEDLSAGGGIWSELPELKKD